MIRQIQKELQRIDQSKSGLRRGEVTSVSPLKVTVSGGSTEVEAAALDGVELAVGDPVSVQVQGNTVLVQGRTTSDPQMSGGRDWFNVKEFGAKGDNSTDDSAACQAALNAASGGGAVFFPAGIYRIGTTLEIGDYVSVFGVGSASKLRCSGNLYALKFASGGESRVSNLYFDSGPVQSSGGAMDWRNAGGRIMVDHLFFGGNLHTSMDMRCSSPSGIWQLTDLQWTGGYNRVYGFRIGDGTNLITDVSIKGMIASGYGGTETWFEVMNKVDTLKCSDITCYGGNVGMTLGQNATGEVTGMQLTNVLMDNMSSSSIAGIALVKTRGATLVGCDVQTCAGGGIDIQGLSKGTTVAGGVVQGNDKSGIYIRDGATDTQITAVQVADNNSHWNGSGFEDGGSYVGIDVAADTSWFRISNCNIGNYLLGRGYQRYGIRIASGSSNHYQIIGNAFQGNVTGDITNGASGTDALTRNNMGSAPSWTSPSLSGVTNYSSAGYRRRDDGTVECRGEIQASSNLAANSTMFTFPAGSRPTVRCYLPLIDYAGSSAVAVLVGTDGTVKNVSALSNGNVYSLASIRFPTA